MAYSAGTAYVEIIPDMRGFRRTLSAELNAINEELQVRVTPEVDRTAVERIRRSLSGLDTKAKVDVDTNRATAAVRSLGSALTSTTGLVGILGAAGANLAPQLVGALVQIAGAAALIPAAIAAAGASFAAIKIGISGVGDAFKALKTADDSSAADAKSAASSRDASAKQMKNAIAGVASAQQALDGANRSARQAQTDLTKAREDATRVLRDLNTETKDSSIGVEEAQISYEQAVKRLSDLKAQGASSLDIRDAEVGIKRASLSLDEAKTRYSDVTKEAEKANKAGVEGSDQVVSAQERVQDANLNVANTAAALTTAQEAVRDASKAAGDQGSASADKVSAAMAKLSPNAAAFVTAVQSMKGAWTDLKNSVQDALFDNLGAKVKELASAQLPGLKVGLTGIAGGFNQAAINVSDFLSSAQGVNDVHILLDNTTKATGFFAQAMTPITKTFSDFVAVGATFLPQLSAEFGGVAQRVSDFIARARETGQLGTWIQGGIDALKSLGATIGNVASGIGGILSASQAAGSGGLLETIQSLTGALADFINSLGGQEVLTQFFVTLKQVSDALLPSITTLAQTIGQVFQAIAPALPPLAQAVTQIVNALAPALGPLAGAIAAIVLAVAPLLVVIAQIAGVLGGLLAQAVMALMPFLQVFAQLVGTILTAAMTALKPALDALVVVFANLAPVLTQISGVLANALVTAIQALAPLLPVIVNAFGSILTALGPILVVVADFVGQLLNALLPILPPIVAALQSLATDALIPLLNALRPIFPVVATLATTLITALAPVIPVIIGALVLLINGALIPILNALMPILPIVAELAGQLLGVLMPVIAPLLGIFVQLINEALVPLLPPLLDLITSILPILTPLIGLLGLAVNILVPIIQFLATVLTDILVFVINFIVIPAIKLISIVLGAVVDFIVFVWNTILKPVFDEIGSGFQDLGAFFNWVWVNILKPVFDFFGAIATWIWNTILKPTFDLIGNAFNAFGEAFAWVYHNIIEPIFKFFGDTASKFGDTFNTIVEGVKTVWASLQEGFKAPIKFIVDTVWNHGVGGFWKAADGFLGGILPDWQDAPVPFATGGVLPGYKPGVDSVPAILSPGEAIMRPEWARAVGPAWVNQANRVAKGGPGAVKRFMNYGGESLAQYADGGIVAGAQQWANSQVGHGYLMGGVGPSMYDCSGFMSAITNYLQGRPLFSRRFATGSFTKNSGVAGFVPGLSSSFSIGVSPNTGDGIGHMAGTLGGLNVESRGGTGVVTGGAARGADNKLFPWQFSLPQVGGGFVSGGGEGNGGGFFQWLKETFIGPAFDGLQRLVDDGVAGLGLGNSPLSTIPAGLANNLIKSARDMVMGSAESAGGSSGPTGAGVERWKGVVDQALTMLNLPLSLEGSTLRRMQQESSGDPNIVNTWDSNAKKGTPSKGLMQMIQPTFDRWWDTRTPHDILNPLSNVVASMRYALGKYGSLPAAYDRKGGYDNGGWLQPGSTLAVNRSGVPEAILTARQWDSVSKLISQKSEGGDNYTINAMQMDEQRLARELQRRKEFKQRASVM